MSLGDGLRTRRQGFAGGIPRYGITRPVHARAQTAGASGLTPGRGITLPRERSHSN